MDQHAVSHLDTSNFDICMINNYNPTSEIEENLDNYENIYVVAWSLGVWAAGIALNKFKIRIAKAIALNGTLTPIDADFGIDPTIFAATLEGWNERNRNKFNMRMLGGREQIMQLNNRLGERTIDNQREELQNILTEVTTGESLKFPYHCALIGCNDLIFTPKNQRQSWSGQTRVVETETPHYPFEMFRNWNQIIEL